MHFFHGRIVLFHGLCFLFLFSGFLPPLSVSYFFCSPFCAHRCCLSFLCSSCFFLDSLFPSRIASCLLNVYGPGLRLPICIRLSSLQLFLLLYQTLRFPASFFHGPALFFHGLSSFFHGPSFLFLRLVFKLHFFCHAIFRSLFRFHSLSF